MNIYELEKQTNVGLARSVFTLRTDAEARMRIHCRQRHGAPAPRSRTVQPLVGQAKGEGYDV